MKRIFRFVVSFLLICVILVNCSPIRARAVEPVTMVMVSAATVIASVMIGIGVMMGQNREAFDHVVQMVQGANALKDFIQQDATKGDVIPLYRSPGTGGVGSGALSLLVAGALIEAIRQVLFANDVISSDSSFPSLPGDYSQYIVYKGASSGTIYCYCGDAAKNYVEPPLSDGDKSVCFLSPFWAYTLQSGSWVEYDNGVSVSIYASSLAGGYPIWSSFDIFTDSSMTQIFFNGSSKSSFGISTSVLDGLVPGEIAPQEQELSEGYADWVSGSQWDVNNSQWWPVAVAPTYDETVNFSQEQVQKGEGTITDADLEDNSDSEQDPDSDQVTASSLKGWLDGIKDRMTLLLQPLALTVSNILDGVISLPEAIVSPIKDFFTPSGNIEAYALDLKLLFPFCIPFDLFNLLKALQADPVAPHFDFELDFGSLGRFPVSVDFSEWNDLASLLRTLETALFVVGLAVGTRKLIGG